MKIRVTPPARQRGDAAGVLLLLVVIGIFALAAIRLVPGYIDNYTIRDCLTSLKKDAGAKGMDPHEIKQKLLRRFDINSVADSRSKDISIEKDGNNYAVHVDYERRSHFIGNVYFVQKFKNKVEVPAS